MGRQSHVEKSPFLDEIIQCLEKGWSYKEIYRYLKARYSGERIPSYYSIRNFGRKWTREIRKAVALDEKRQSIISREVRSSVLAAQQLRKNLEMCAQGLEALWSEWLKTRDYLKLRDLTNLITSTNRSIELLLKFQEEISEMPLSEDEILDRLLYCIRDFPPDLVTKFRERWEEYGRIRKR
jgi:hypothetical protein